MSNPSAKTPPPLCTVGVGFSGSERKRSLHHQFVHSHYNAVGRVVSRTPPVGEMTEFESPLTQTVRDSHDSPLGSMEANRTIKTTIKVAMTVGS